MPFLMTPGEKNNRLTATRKIAIGTRNTPARWLFRCDCGTDVEARVPNVRSGHVKSCGCLRSEIAKTKTKTHGRAKTTEWVIWVGIKQRCLNKKSAAYSYYGGRGVTIHLDLAQDFQAFYEHVGARPGTEYSLDRIDNDKGYEPGNLRWATRSEQMKNRRVAKRIAAKFATKNGEMTVSDIAIKSGLNSKTVYERLSAGWNADRIIETPVRVFR